MDPNSTLSTGGTTFKLASYDNSLNSRVAMTFPVHVTRDDPVHAIALSNDGNLLAIGNDGGRLEIRSSGDGWEAIRIYRTGGSIRAMLWHPSQDRTLFVGCGNGNVYRITFQAVLDDEEISFGNVRGFVHAIAFQDSKGQLAVGFENSVVLFDRPFTETGRLGASKLADAPKVHKGSDVRLHPFARGIHYLDKDTVLVAFYGKVGMIAYSTSSGDVLWGIKLEFSTSIICSSALSPSREILAIANTRTGIDWYSTTHKRFLMTTRYDTEVISEKLNYVVGATFIDAFTIAVGNTSGRLIYAQLGMTAQPPELHVGSRSQVVQAVSSGEIDGSTTVVTVLPVDDQGLQDKTKRSGAMEVKVAVVVIRHPPKADKAKLIQALPAPPSVQAPPDSLGTLLATMTMRDKYLSLALCVIIIFGAAVALFPRNPTEDTIHNASIAATITMTKMELTTQVETVFVTSTKTELVRQVETVTSMATELTRQFTTETIFEFITSPLTSQASDSMCICTLTGTFTAMSPTRMPHILEVQHEHPS